MSVLWYIRNIMSTKFQLFPETVRAWKVKDPNLCAAYNLANSKFYPKIVLKTPTRGLRYNAFTMHLQYEYYISIHSYILLRFVR